MMYTEKDVNEAAKVLFFEGAGCVERGDVENCRIRTAFVNDNGTPIYLELWGVEVTKKSPERHKQYKNAGFVDYCYEITPEGEKYYFDVERWNFEYSKLGILNFVNQHLHCSFTEIKILDMFDGYRVHKNGGGYNFIEDYTYNEKHAEAARNAFNEIDMEIRAKLGEKYSKISLASIEEDGITVRCYASDKSMSEHGMDPKQRYIKVEF